MDTRWRKVLDNGLRDLAQEEPDAFQLERSLARIKTDSHRRHTLMKTTRKTAFSVAAVAVLFAALLLIPATYTITVGHVVTIDLPGFDRSQVHTLHQSLSALPFADRVGIVMTPDGMQVQMGVDETDASTLREAIRTELTPIYAGFDSSTLTIEPVKVERGGNALAAITGGQVQLNVTGMNDGEIEQAITSALMAKGASAVNVDVSTSPDGGEREIRIEMEADGIEAGDNGEFQIILEDDNVPSDGQQQSRQMEWIQEDE